MKKINLDNVTIICIDGVNPEIGLKALKYSMKDINFAKAILLSHIKPKSISNDIEFIEIEKLSHTTYNSFILQNLDSYFNTDFCLTIHDDGFVINPHLWTDDFLKYDYIGAPWGPEYGNYRVGNGGFSLRSKKFTKLSKLLHNEGHEDAICCIYNKKFMEENGCVYAPLEIAMKFSLETKIPECSYDLNNTFGFHGKGVVDSVHFGEGQQFKDKLNLLNFI